MSNVNIEPFGSGLSSLVPVQKFMGATIAKFNCSADFASQPGSCAIELVVDTTDNDVFNPGVIGSPKFFKIVDNSGVTIFGFNGILDSISRDSGPDNKVYRASIVSPLRVLQATTLVINTYAGYGAATEGLPQFFSEDGYYQIEDSDKQPGYLPDGVSMTPTEDYFKTGYYSFATNNSNLSFTGMWERAYNIINVFGAYENEWIKIDPLDPLGVFGPPISERRVAVVPFAGFGASSSNAGMRVDKIAYAIDQLVNKTNATSIKRYIGGNLLYGTNTYNICDTAQGNVPPFPYYYGIDIIGFISSALYYLPEDFLITGDSISLADFIANVCDAINADFLIELNDETYKEGIFYADLLQTYPNSIFGGIISIIIIPKNTYVNCNRPFSEFTYDLLNLERPDAGDYGIIIPASGAGKINPGLPPYLGDPNDTGVTLISDGTRFINPLDIDYTQNGTDGSRPYGGRFPVVGPETGVLLTSVGTPQALASGIFDRTASRPISLSVGLKASDVTAAKMVVGGFQTRMNVVPRDYIYQYWGEISLVSNTGEYCSATATSTKSIPVITQTLPPNDTWDWVAIDMQSIFSQETIVGVCYDGIYFASMLEIRAAMVSYEAWETYLRATKKHKIDVLEGGGLDVLRDKITTSNVATTRKYMSLRGFAGASTQAEEFDLPDDYEIIKQICEKVKDIGDTHYGKSWVAPIPLFRTKTTESDTSLVGNVVKSWDITDSAYVEPYAYNQMEAPKDSSFMQDGRLKCFANFEHSFVAGGSDDLCYGLLSGQLSGFASGVKYKYDFSEHSNSTVFDIDPAGTGDCPVISIAHAPMALSEDYIYLTPKYFDYYNRGYCPIIDSVDPPAGTGTPPESMSTSTTNFYMYEYTFSFKQIADAIGVEGLLSNSITDPDAKVFFSSSGVVDTMKERHSEIGVFASSGLPYDYIKVYTPPFGVNEIGPSGYFNTLTSKGLRTQVLSNYEAPNNNAIDNINLVSSPSVTGMYDSHFAFTYSGTALKDILYGIKNQPVVSAGSGLPFIKFTTSPVYYPSTFQSDGVNPLSAKYIDEMSNSIRLNAIDSLPDQLSDFAEFGEEFGKSSASRAAVSPKAVGVPQKSNRYVYGPWMTNFENTIFCGKFDYERDEDLVPENFMMPIYGDITTNWQVVNADGSVSRVVSTVKGTSLSGFAGMNLAGQATANSIDNFSLFAQEEGTLTLPGLPIIQRIGGVIPNGPRITDLNITFNSSEVQTTYNFRSLSQRFGKDSRDVVRKLRKLSDKLRPK